MPPCHFSAVAIAVLISDGLVRSIDRGSTASGWASVSSSRRTLSRAVTATRWPARNAAFATEAPRPLDAPVMNQVCVLIVSFFLYVAGFPIGRPASAQALTPTIRADINDHAHVRV